MGKKIALAGYPAEYFKHFADHLTANGYDVFWICGLTSDANFLIGSGVKITNILDVNQGFDASDISLEEVRACLHSWEDFAWPLANDIILMDRLLSRKSPDFAHRYMAHLGSTISGFLDRNRVRLVTSWRDTALQLMTMLVCKRLNISFVIPTRARIPQEMYMFCTSHHTADYVQLREVREEDRIWARNFLEKFRGQGLKPALKRAARGFIDVARMLPAHLRAFFYELRRAPADLKNDYARYPLVRLIKIYLTRKFNLVMYKLVKPGEIKLPAEKFVLYALHTQPESSIDVVGSYFSDQINLVKFIARSLPATHALYVKIHPTDMDGKSLEFYRELKKIPGVKLIDYSVNSRDLLLKCEFLFALSGTIAYEAALLDKPVIVFAKNFFNELPAIHYCDAPPNLPSLIHEILSDSARDPLRDFEIIEFLSKLHASSFDGEVSRFHLGQKVHLTAGDLATVLHAYDSLWSRLENKLDL